MRGLFQFLVIFGTLSALNWLVPDVSFWVKIAVAVAAAMTSFRLSQIIWKNET